MYHQDIQSFLQQIYNYMNWHTEKINNLETALQQLQEEISLKQQEPINQLDMRMQQFRDEVVSKQQMSINQLSTIVQQLQSEISSLKKQHPVIVEKMEYKFDQLKVETLEGTLNIGITPNGFGEIEEFSTNDQTVEDMPIYPQHSRFQQIKNHIDNYLHSELPKEIRVMERRQKYKVNEEFRQFIIEDIKKQVDQRIHHYLNQMNTDATDNDSGTIEQTVIKKVKKDIRSGIESYLNKLSREEKSS
ncbi:spore germination protein GerPC [Aneurinibacillus danicus]|uniref:Spore germination protein GerPC n=1 Tax=Aneurinibacillus danicus TaxID=267746 RepID=A0A511V963_9BACL|nr:spore germination protein GerPC [Aneurinibacillus danicus]GEN35465.1 hypothetical protein ADA01nite_29250 [Aneurinibacillus danicus]